MAETTTPPAGTEAETDEVLVKLKLPPEFQKPTITWDLARALGEGLRSQYPAPWETRVEAKDDASDEAQEARLSLRQGMQLGVDVKIIKLTDEPNTVGIGVEPATKLGQFITLAVMIPFIAIPAVMSAMHMAPFDFLPGTRIAALLGGLIGFVAAIPVFMVANALVGRGRAKENQELMHAVAKHVDAIANQYLGVHTAPAPSPSAALEDKPST